MAASNEQNLAESDLSSINKQNLQTQNEKIATESIWCEFLHYWPPRSLFVPIIGRISSNSTATTAHVSLLSLKLLSGFCVKYDSTWQWLIFTCAR